MKIWFDISNSPHINLFAAMIRDLESEGHDINITCRPLANTIDLLELHGFRYTIVGEHYGARLSRKLLGYPIRVAQLVKHVRHLDIDVAIAQSSFHLPVVARLLGIRSIYMNDNEHALGNVPSFLTATRVLVPECFTERNLRRHLARSGKVRRYPGVKEGIYLWHLQEKLDATRLARPATNAASVFVRPEPWSAQYYKGDRNFLDATLTELQHHVRITILPRGASQGDHYRSDRFAQCRIIDTAMDLAQIAPQCDLFIGAGGTMTREMAVLGIPTISVYQDDLLDVDRHLLKLGAFLHRPNLSAAEVLHSLSQDSPRTPNRPLLEQGKLAYQQIRLEILARTAGRRS